MNLHTALILGRVSNLPTVWTNALAGIVLSGFSVFGPGTIAIVVAMSLFYTGGMFLNDAFDAEIDARERSERPIPAGRVSRRTVFVWGFAMLCAALLILAWIGMAGATGTGIWPLVGGLALAASIIVYDRHHKNNPLSPLIMGICRMLVYVTAGLCFIAPVPVANLLGALVLLSYLVGLTYTAKQENIGKVENAWPLGFLALPVIAGIFYTAGQPAALLVWGLFTGWVGYCLWLVRRREAGDIPRAVGGMIAGIALLDAVLIASADQHLVADFAIAGFLLTLAFQRYIPGT